MLAKEDDKKFDSTSVNYESVFSKPDKNLKNDEKEKIPFRNRINDLLSKNIGNFVWGTVHYCVDIQTRKIFYASKASSLSPHHKHDFPQGAKANFITKKNVIYYNLNGKSIDECNTGEKISDYLSRKQIIPVEAPKEISQEESTDLKCELLNCVGFVIYILVEAVRMERPDFPYHWLAEQTALLVGRYFDDPDRIKGIGFEGKNIQKGDLLLFSIIGSGMQGLIGKHIGFFYGYNENGFPLICDLWDRDGSRYAKIVDFQNCSDYEKHSFVVKHLSLDALYAELKVSLSKNVPGFDKNLSMV